MRISDVIAAYILERLDETESGYAELQRNLLAEELGCVPSQINYVLTSRFTPEHGYLVESRRGGGGYIRVYRVPVGNRVSPLMHLVEALEDTLEQETARRILQNLSDRGLIDVQSARLMAAALSDRSYADVPPAQRDRVRSTMMKQLLTTLSL